MEDSKFTKYMLNLDFWQLDHGSLGDIASCPESGVSYKIILSGVLQHSLTSKEVNAIS